MRRLRRTRRADAVCTRRGAHDARPPPVLVFDDGDWQMRCAGSDGDGAAPRAALTPPRFSGQKGKVFCPEMAEMRRISALAVWRKYLYDYRVVSLTPRSADV
ncbi:MAG: hypothetical protein MPL62_00810 [Alphaproteobacteria bacterium]|nr:hypothetical protein [Alphaproteobacteria bacterium]